METNSHPEAAASNVKQGQYSPRKRKDTTPRVNPQLAVELVYQELKRVEVYTKRIEDATARKVQIDGKSLESAENRLKNVLADFEACAATADEETRERMRKIRLLFEEHCRLHVAS